MVNTLTISGVKKYANLSDNILSPQLLLYEWAISLADPKWKLGIHS